MRSETAIPDPDGFYAELVAMHAGLDPGESLKLCARLILLLANEVGDAVRLREILDAARAPR